MSASPTDPDPLDARFAHLTARISAACAAAGRDPDSVTLIGASKTQPAATLRAAHRLGLRHCGENYLDEALAKTTHLRDLDLTWHYIGRVQSNKTRHIATHFEWLHTLDRDKIASRLSEQLPTGRRLQCLVQVNIDADPAKAGVHVDDVRSLVHACERYQNLQLRGLMTILDPQSDPAASYRSMAQLAARIRDDLRPAAADRFDCLSMGMTADLEAAVAAGATHIRIGTALFGPRPSGVDAPSNAQANSDADAVVDDKRHDRNER